MAKISGIEKKDRIKLVSRGEPIVAMARPRPPVCDKYRLKGDCIDEIRRRPPA